MSEMSKQTKTNNLNYLIVPEFNKANRLLVFYAIDCLIFSSLKKSEETTFNFSRNSVSII